MTVRGKMNNRDKRWAGRYGHKMGAFGEALGNAKWHGEEEEEGDGGCCKAENGKITMKEGHTIEFSGRDCC